MVAKKSKGRRRSPYLSWGKAIKISEGSFLYFDRGDAVTRGETIYLAIGYWPQFSGRPWTAFRHRSKGAAIKRSRWLRRGYVIELRAILTPE